MTELSSGRPAVEWIPPSELARRLMDEHNTWTVAITRPAAGIEGVRITPHVFTTTAELDTLGAALERITAE